MWVGTLLMGVSDLGSDVRKVENDEGKGVDKSECKRKGGIGRN